MPTIEKSIESSHSLLEIRAAILSLIDAGMTREEIFEGLDVLRLRFREEGKERQEELAEAAMDLFTGWTHSSLQI